MADKTPVVMISSTVRDLTEHRQGIMEACLRLDMLPQMMEHLAAADDGGLAESLRLVDEADIYLGVFGHRYGYIPKGKTKSITHYEYERATQRGIPRLIFVMHDDHPVKAGDVERGRGRDKLEQLRSKLLREHTVNFFRSPDDLRTLVLNTLAQHKQKDPTPPPDASASGAQEGVVLTARLAAKHDSMILQQIGCPCLVLKLVCESERPAKISGAKLHVRGPHVLAAVQRAFSSDLGCVPGEVQFIEDPGFSMSFLPTAKPDTSHGFVIARDDVRAFFLPAACGSLLYFAEAPPKDAYLTVDFLDGRHETLLQGVEVQREIPGLVRACLDRQYLLNPRITLTMGLELKAWQLPDVPTKPGFLNDETFHLPPHPQRDEPVDEESDRIRLRAKILRAGGEWDRSYEEWLIGLVREHADKEVRRDAIVALRRLATPKVREIFFDLLTTEFNENTRELIIRSFALVGTTEDMPVMERMAQDETSRFCREAAMTALQYLRHRSAKPTDDAPGQEIPDRSKRGDRHKM